MKKERILFFDNFKGILIILVVLAHYFFDYFQDVHQIQGLISFIYLFHMPVFLFVSGYLTSKNPSKESFYKLLIYYFIFNTFMMLYCFALQSMPIQFLNSYNSYWYLASLFIMRLFIKRIEKVKFLLPLSIAISFLCSFYNWYLTPISKTLVLFPFFIAGYQLEKSKVEDFIKNRNYKSYLLGFVLIFICLMVGHYIVTNLNFTTDILTFGRYSTFKDVIYRAIMFFYSSLIIITAFFLIPNKRIPLISSWGKNSICIYVMHRFFTLAFSYYFPANSWNLFYLFYGILLTIFTLLAFGNNLFRNCFDKIFNGIVNNKKPEKVIFTGLLIFTIFMFIFQFL